MARELKVYENGQFATFKTGTYFAKCIHCGGKTGCRLMYVNEAYAGEVKTHIGCHFGIPVR